MSEKEEEEKLQSSPPTITAASAPSESERDDSNNDNSLDVAVDHPELIHSGALGSVSLVPSAGPSTDEGETVDLVAEKVPPTSSTFTSTITTTTAAAAATDSNAAIDAVMEDTSGIAYYMNRMPANVFVQFLTCIEPIPFFQDPALVAFRRRRRHEQAAAAAASHKKRTHQAETPVRSNKRQSRTAGTASASSSVEGGSPIAAAIDNDSDNDSLEDEVVDATEHANYLMYSWESLQLGRVTGSAAVNRHLVDRLQAQAAVRVPQWTAVDCLHAVQHQFGEFQTVLPLASSELHGVLHRTRLENERVFQSSRNDGNDDESTKGPCWESLARLYQDMVAQDVDGGDTLKREYQFLKAHDVKDRMTRMETTVASLAAQEERVRRTANSLGLLNAPTSTKVGAMLGDWQHDGVDSGDDDAGVFWDKDFPALLKKGGTTTGFLTWHDVW